MLSDITGYWTTLQETLSQVAVERIDDALDELMRCYAHNGTVFVIGNGGSAATASHFACDLVKGTRTAGMPTFRCFPLTDNVPLMTAWANDTNYAAIFSEQLISLIRPHDILVAISASGNSSNVIAGVQTALEAGIPTIGLTGRTGGRLARLASIVVKIPSSSIEQVEDAHLMVAHSLCVAVRGRLRAAAAGALGASLASAPLSIDGKLAAQLKKRDFVA